MVFLFFVCGVFLIYLGGFFGGFFWVFFKEFHEKSFKKWIELLFFTTTIFERIKGPNSDEFNINEFFLSNFNAVFFGGVGGQNVYNNGNYWVWKKLWLSYFGNGFKVGPIFKFLIFGRCIKLLFFNQC